MDVFRIGFLVLGIALFVWSVIRWQVTAESDPEYPARRDMTFLLALVVVGQAGDLLRTRFPDRSAGFFACSFALIPIAMAAVYMLWRLFRAYRRSHASTPPSQT